MPLWRSALLVFALSSLWHAEATVIKRAAPAAVLTPEFDAWMGNLTTEWGIRGVSIAVVQLGDDGNWITETKGYGAKDEAGSNVTAEVSFSFLFQDYVPPTFVELRPNLPSVPTRSYSRLFLLAF